MSTYKDIYSDYPRRCGEVWEQLRGLAEDEGREVTFMLMTAAGGLAMPWEHLREPRADPAEIAAHVADQPAFMGRDDDHYEKCLKRLRAELDKRFGQSALGNKPHRLAGWFYDETPELGRLRDLAEYGGASSSNVAELGARRIVNVLRNALAHNNMYAFAKEGGEAITHLAFYSSHRDHAKGGEVQPPAVYRLLVVPVDEMGRFLDNWFDLIRRSIPKRPRISTIHLLHDSLQPAA